jgi:hypothetical protein
VVTPEQSDAARLDIDYPEELDRFTTLARLFLLVTDRYPPFSLK